MTLMHPWLLFCQFIIKVRRYDDFEQYKKKNDKLNLE